MLEGGTSYVFVTNIYLHNKFDMSATIRKDFFPESQNDFSIEASCVHTFFIRNEMT